MVPDLPDSRSVSGASLDAGTGAGATGVGVAGVMVMDPPTPVVEHYVELAREARDAGLFRRAPLRTLVRAGLIVVLLEAGVAALLLLGNSWYQLVVAAYLAVVFGQIGFFGHEVGHRQVFGSRRINGLVGLACANLATGISYGYWTDKHDRHHSHPNEVGLDPDVADGVFSWSAEQTETKTGLRRLLARHQAALFFPFLLLEGANLHVASARALNTSAVKRVRLEVVLLALHAAAYLTAVFLIMSPLRAVVFLIVQQGLFGFYLGCAFAPNHKGMLMPPRGDKLDFLRRQVATSRNVRGSWALGVAMGGLNYQIEHHLFPTMPMANLRRCRPMVRAFCSRHGIDYCETGLTSSYVTSLRHLRRAGRPMAA
jgi:fatty acid desaturase